MTTVFRGVIFFCSFAVATLHSLEFGNMGGLSASMGGAGVALKSPYGLYYNPALIASESKVSLGITLGGGMTEENLDKLLTVDVKRLASSLSSLSSQIAGKNIGLGFLGSSGGSGVASASITLATIARSVGNDAVAKASSIPTLATAVAAASAPAVQNNLLEVIKQSLKDVSNGSSSGGSGNDDLKKLLDDYKSKNSGDFSSLVNKIVEKVKTSSIPSEQKQFAENLAKSVDWKNVNFDGSGISTFAMSKGNNKDLDRSMEDLSGILEALRDSRLSIKSKSGIILEVSPGSIRSEIGSFAVGVFNSVEGIFQLSTDPDKLRLIIGGNGNGGSGSDYYELKVSNDGYIFSKSSKDDFEKHSLLAGVMDGKSHKAIGSVLVMTEIPVGYGYTFYYDRSNLSLGMALKYENAYSSYHEVSMKPTMEIGENMSSVDKMYDGFQSSSSVGMDLGVYYEMDLDPVSRLAFGLVAKNVNVPTFKFGPTKLKVKPQYRVGTSYHRGAFTVAIDADIMPNETISLGNKKAYSQVLGGGVVFDYKGFDFRGGMAYDFRQNNGLILTAGIGMFGVVDFSAEMGTKFFELNDSFIPKHARIRAGTSFSF